MTDWRFIAEECIRASVQVRLAEPPRPQTTREDDKLDARLLRELLMHQRLPQS